MEIELADSEPLLEEDAYPMRPRPSMRLPVVMEIPVHQVCLVVRVATRLNPVPPLLTLTHCHCPTYEGGSHVTWRIGRVTCG